MGCYSNGQCSCIHPLCEDCNPEVNRKPRKEPKNEINVKKSAWQDVLDILGLELEEGKTVDDIKYISKKTGIVYK